MCYMIYEVKFCACYVGVLAKWQGQVADAKS